MMEREVTHFAGLPGKTACGSRRAKLAVSRRDEDVTCCACKNTTMYVMRRHRRRRVADPQGGES